MSNENTPVICWFRRDLRLSDHLALAAAVKTGQLVIPLFIFDPKILKSKRFSAPRYKFMVTAVESLRTELHKHQRELLIRHGDALEVLNEVIQETGANQLFFNTDYTPYARKRDEAIIEQLEIPVQTFHDRLLSSPDAIEKNAGGPYTVYTPYKKKWRTQIKPDETVDYDVSAVTIYDIDGLNADALPTLDALGFRETIDIPEASEREALRRLNAFMDGHVYTYQEGRNKLGNPDDDPRTETSFLSPYVRFGLLSLRQIYWSAREAYDNAQTDDQRESVKTFVDEIIWHEFYTQILWHFPHVKTENFHAKYDHVEWEDNNEALQAWKEGMTGYPIVDAAMRQLKSIGWMHNRARMIVASFLTKDLLIDWREGELHFMQWLLDGDLAANNGGWQWAAGTGTDAQPYFRIFNPVSQSKKFDPDGEYIRRWVPELRDVPDKYIHEPWIMDTPPENYPAPIVDHSEARKRTLEAFEVVKQA